RCGNIVDDGAVIRLVIEIAKGHKEVDHAVVTCHTKRLAHVSLLEPAVEPLASSHSPCLADGAGSQIHTTHPVPVLGKDPGMTGPPTREVQNVVSFLGLDCALQQVYNGFRFSVVTLSIYDFILLPFKPLGVPHFDCLVTPDSYEPRRNKFPGSRHY